MDGLVDWLNHLILCESLMDWLIWSRKYATVVVAVIEVVVEVVVVVVVVVEVLVVVAVVEEVVTTVYDNNLVEWFLYSIPAIHVVELDWISISQRTC